MERRWEDGAAPGGWNGDRDLSNGYITAEIFSWYYPDDIQMHSFENGTSLPAKLGNWSLLEKFFMKKKLNVSKELIDGTIHCKPGAAEILVQEIYVMLTHRSIIRLSTAVENRSMLRLSPYCANKTPMKVYGSPKNTDYTRTSSVTCEKYAALLQRKAATNNAALAELVAAKYFNPFRWIYIVGRYRSSEGNIGGLSTALQNAADKPLMPDNEVDFTDRHYQDGLPMVARSTATKAVKSNITLSEILAEPDMDVNKQKVQAVLDIHLQQRQQDRIADPKRFNVKPSLGERAIRLMPSSNQNQSESSLTNRSSSSSLSSGSSEYLG
ncbi:unnamed protein product [Ranitomeya imitator]|uniref:CH-like domain-containing protein n=1 Tax=Ranitomeya imitator TaxID=111125 RepID=A0ABN9LTS9_9NEOB|nr:unnamed protein product [Ranitomeya imitator]